MTIFICYRADMLRMQRRGYERGLQPRRTCHLSEQRGESSILRVSVSSPLCTGYNTTQCFARTLHFYRIRSCRNICPKRRVLVVCTFVSSQATSIFIFYFAHVVIQLFRIFVVSFYPMIYWRKIFNSALCVIVFCHILNNTICE